MEKQSLKTNLVVTGILALFLGGGAGFVGGMQYQQRKTATSLAQFGGMGGRGLGGGNGQQRGRFGGGRPVIGDILSVDDTSMTVKLADGSSRIVILSSTTAINKASQAAKTDLKVGERVAAYGADNSDGSMTAQSVQLNPILMMRPSGSPTVAPPQQ